MIDNKTLYKVEVRGTETWPRSTPPNERGTQTNQNLPWTQTKLYIHKK